jgi:acyl-CoA reductase-like NAD-dependent aldehyde dehydrogenase
MRDYQLYINGEFVESVSKHTIDSINPFDQTVVARVSRASLEDARRAVEAARKAFDEGPWPLMSRQERSALLKAV